jgi:hypothetical protein
MKNMIMSNKFAMRRKNTIRSSTHYKITHEINIGRRNIGNKLVCKKETLAITLPMEETLAK